MAIIAVRRALVHVRTAGTRTRITAVAAASKTTSGIGTTGVSMAIIRIGRALVHV